MSLTAHAPGPRARAALFVMALTLAACQGQTPSRPAPQASEAVRARATARPGAGPAAKPTAAAEPLVPATTAPATAGATAAPAAAPAILAKPATPSRTLAGVVRIEAAYAVTTGGARIVSNNGGTAIAAGAGVISNNSGNLIAPFRLLQDAPADAPALGEILPAAGLVLQARALRTGDLVPLGVDAAGAPVTAVLTNAAGGFTLYVPESAERLLLEARFPAGSPAADPRLAYDLLPPGTAPAPDLVLDEDTAQVTRYVREACRGTLARFALTDDVEATVATVLSESPAGVAEPLAALIREMRAASAASGLDKAPRAEIDRVAARMTDALLARIALEDVKLLHAYWPDWDGPEEPAIPALVDVMRRIRVAATAKLAADPGFFARQPYLAAANAGLPADAPRWEIKKPADLNDLIVRVNLVQNKQHVETEAILDGIGVEAAQSQRLYAAVNNYIGTIATTLFVDAEAKAGVLAVIEAWGGSP